MAIVVYFVFFQSDVERVYYKESPYCQTDADCVNYNCTSCGNRYWVEKNVPETQLVCKKQLPKTISCTCQAGQCKRVYK